MHDEVRADIRALAITYLRAADEAAWETHTEADEVAEAAAWDKLSRLWAATLDEREPGTVSQASYVRFIDNTVNWEVTR